MLTEASQIGATRALVAAGVVKPTITRKEAVDVHGRKLIEKLERAKLIKRLQREEKGRYYFDVNELNNAIIAENRHRFFKGNGKDQS
ncbi:hypothetical protein [Sphingobacterium sp. UBA6645]|uniref:hypothetical protein n=1 Tax=Sphingobacterium sp. UBA6645 TaxID=1947511 RepID=UPI0025F0F2A8|nr:hypothetical protein [Sphingobacterium sp. UBA6645]